jgi:hypothetical protein
MFYLECHTIRLPIRQRVIDMFEKEVMRRIVLDECSDDEADESEESQPNTARPPDTSKTIRPPEAARSSPEKVRSPLLRSPESAKSPATARPVFGMRKKSEGM